MHESKKTSEYCSNITKALLFHKRNVLFIPIVIAILPSIVKSVVEKPKLDWHLLVTPANIVYSLCLVVLFFWYYSCLVTKDKLEADKGYYDTEILAMREKTIDCMQQRSQIGLYNMAVFQVSQLSVAMDYALIHFRKMIEQPILSTEDVIKITDELINSVNNILQNYYRSSAQEKLNFALYYYCAKTKKYYDLISKKHDNSMHKKGRIWDENDNSHICFVGRQNSSNSIIYDNINEKLPVPENSNSNDKFTYVSSISAPIKLINSTHTNYILSLTSNFNNRFSEDTPDEFINKLNQLFSLFIVNISTLLEIAFNSNLKDKDDEILKHIINDYQKNRPDELKKHKLDGILSNLS